MPQSDTIASAPAARPAPRRVGHKGADLIAPGNTLASFDAALEAGVDMIEFDVLPERLVDGVPDGGLILTHDYKHDHSRAPTLEEGLAHLAAAHYADIELDVDLKLPGYEREVVEALQRHGAVERTLVSSQYVASLDIVRALEPGLRIGWSVPRLSHDPTANPLTVVPALIMLLIYRARLPGRMSRAIRNGRVDAVMAHHRLITRRLVRDVHAAGGEVYAWTVDSLKEIRALGALGVDGVITNDPRLFSEIAV